MENNKEHEQKIIKTLKDFGKLPTARLSAITGINYNSLKIILEEMKKQKLIKCEKAGELATYWILN